jgi:putative endonuclease
MNAIRLTRRQVGANYENQARRYLEHAGLVFVAANVACRAGELDLVEVRYRRNANFGGAAASVTYSKQQRLLRAAAFWLAQHNASFDTSSCRFDVLAITGRQLEWLPDAFNAQG